MNVKDTQPFAAGLVAQNAYKIGLVIPFENKKGSVLPNAH